jgi:hypothetical protein
MGSRARAFHYLHSPGARAATGCARRAQRILRGAAFERDIDPSLGHGGGEIRREDRAVGVAVVGAGQAIAGDLDDRLYTIWVIGPFHDDIGVDAARVGAGEVSVEMARGLRR